MIVLRTLDEQELFNESDLTDYLSQFMDHEDARLIADKVYHSKTEELSLDAFSISEIREHLFCNYDSSEDKDEILMQIDRIRVLLASSRAKVSQQVDQELQKLVNRVSHIYTI